MLRPPFWLSQWASAANHFGRCVGWLELVSQMLSTGCRRCDTCRITARHWFSRGYRRPWTSIGPCGKWNSGQS
jgi:hypothetical protein